MKIKTIHALLLTAGMAMATLATAQAPAAAPVPATGIPPTWAQGRTPDGMNFKAFARCRNTFSQALPFCQGNRCISLICPFLIQKWRPIHCKLTLVITQDWIRGLYAGIHRSSEVLDHLVPRPNRQSTLCL